MTEKILPALEAVLFAIGEPVTLEEISNALEIECEDCKRSLKALQEVYNNTQRGIQLIKMKDRYQLCTKPAYFQYIDHIVKKRNTTGLSQAALETLAIIAYKQPVTRVEVENLRGVKSSSSIQNLTDRNLIKEAGRLDAPGKPVLFKTTLEFLRYAGIDSLEELPAFEEFVNKAKDSEQ